MAIQPVDAVTSRNGRSISTTCRLFMALGVLTVAISAATVLLAFTRRVDWRIGSILLMIYAGFYVALLV